MNEAFARVLARYEDRAKEEERLWQQTAPAEIMARRDEFLLHVGPETGEFLLALAVGRGARRIVEIGTSYGYSTLFLAEAARRTGGRVATLELAKDKQDHARAQLEDAGLADHVDWLAGDALELLDTLEPGVDFVLIDLWKELYVPCLDKLYPRLADNAVIVADNMLIPEVARRDAEAYRAAVRARPDLQSVLLPIGSGIELSCLWRGQV